METTVIFILLAVLVVAVFALWFAILKANENIQLMGFQMISLNDKLKKLQGEEVAPTPSTWKSTNKDEDDYEKELQRDKGRYLATAMEISKKLEKYLGKPPVDPFLKPHVKILGYPIHAKWKAWGSGGTLIWEVWPKKWEDRNQWQCYGVGTLRPMVPLSTVVEEILDELEKLDTNA